MLNEPKSFPSTSTSGFLSRDDFKLSATTYPSTTELEESNCLQLVLTDETASDVVSLLLLEELISRERLDKERKKYIITANRKVI